jgi:type IV pilus assembly protein PilV
MRLNRFSKLRGFTLIEVLITLVVIAIGVLGVGALQARTHLSALESAQRAQAVALANDMISRINLHREVAADYATLAPLGTGAADATDCATLASGPPRDQCEWSKLLKGSAERVGGANAGAMIGARGCIELVQARNDAPGVCQPAIVQVTTAWQGVVETSAPSLACGSGAYGDDRLRRATATRVVIGLPKCL